MAIDKRSSRLGILAAVALILVGALGTRLWFLQGVQAEAYQASVNASKIRTVRLPPERGRIFDADGRVLADNERVLTVTVEWSVMRGNTNRRNLFERLSGPLGKPVEELEQLYQDGKNIYDPLLPMPLVEDIDEETVQYLLERSEDFPGVDVSEGWRRVYPYAPLASHLVGYMSAIFKETKDQYVALGYNLNERVGAFGVEQSMESVLHGQWGYQTWEIDAAGNTVRLLEDVPPVGGNDVQLTIDLDVQQYAEQALETKLKQRRDLPTDKEECKCADLAAHNPIDPKGDGTTRVYASSKEFGNQEWIQYKAPAGSVVVMNNSNGQIIAMASYPTFDNRWFEAGISKRKLDQLFPPTDDPDRSILVNRAVQGRYNIGSTIKPFVAWSAMHSGLITADDIWQDEGVYKLVSVDKEICAEGVRCEFKNALDPFGRPARYGPVRVEDALAVSSDTFFYRLGESFFTLLGRRDELKADLMEFGFGADSGIDLPFEWDGRIPDDAVKKELVDKGVLAKGEAPRLVTGDLVQVAIGQGLFAATPLQLANAYSAIANSGFVMRPHLVKAILTPFTPNAEGVPAMADMKAAEVVTSFEQPEILHQLQMPPEIRDPIVNGLKRVICGDPERKEDCGVYYPETFYHTTTGESLFRDYPWTTMPIAGKTGTAQGAGQYPWNDSSVFASFSLDENRPYTVVAYLEKSGYGSKAAAPVVKCIFTALAEKTTTDPVLPSDPLDINSPYTAAPKKLADPTCLGGYDGSVRE
ncbi:MAG: penicillin-binding transpeptidase domain-containing protein [Acidimicrobiales bacterium]